MFSIYKKLFQIFREKQVYVSKFVLAEHLGMDRWWKWCTHYNVKYNVLWYKKINEGKIYRKLYYYSVVRHTFLDLSHLIVEATLISRNEIENIPRNGNRINRIRRRIYLERKILLFCYCIGVCVYACMCMCVCDCTCTNL